jgi:hypothetical protein
MLRGQEDDLHALAIQADGRIIAAGASSPNGNGYVFALARHLAQ